MLANLWLISPLATQDIYSDRDVWVAPAKVICGEEQMTTRAYKRLEGRRVGASTGATTYNEGDCLSHPQHQLLVDLATLGLRHHR